MKRYIYTLAKHPLISNTFILVAGGVFANLFHFLFNLFMTRSLSVTDYGNFASLISVITLFTIPAGSLSPTILRFAGGYFAKNELDYVRGLCLLFLKMMIIVITILLIGFIIFAPFISSFFHIANASYIIVVGVLIGISYITVINAALLQAKLAFTFITISNFLAALSKFILGVLLISSGFGVVGALVGFALATIFPFAFSFLKLQFLFNKHIKIPQINNKELLLYGAPSAIAMLGLTSFTSSDILLVKHFFNPSQAGLYAGLAIIGKVIFYFTIPIGTVMFPIIVQKHAREEEFTNTFWLALFLVLLPSLVMVTFYMLFPQFTIRFFLKNDSYLVLSPYLALFGIYILMYSLLFVIVSFFLAIKKTVVALPVFIAAISQIVILSFFHRNFYEIILTSIGITSVLFFVLFIYFFKLYMFKNMKNTLAE